MHRQSVILTLLGQGHSFGILMATGLQAGVTTDIVAELWALRDGLIPAVESVIVEADATTVISASTCSNLYW
ncbi:hypothetical protein J1N35_030497 [Gossypium stocksii]|uniref:RNase H type-1 domain-containing protein n=1 Tax=Gossypium stocksii TaxID=47602 RepID=A0A9D3V074_9ROSI|nr:hypothetical protein J1N35_030497 [Gossypium stocksii]